MYDRYSWIERAVKAGRLNMMLLGVALWIGGCGGFVLARNEMTPASVSVSGYTRRDGTHVSGYNRRPPGSVSKDRPYQIGSCFAAVVSVVGMAILVGNCLDVPKQK